MKALSFALHRHRRKPMQTSAAAMGHDCLGVDMYLCNYLRIVHNTTAGSTRGRGPFPASMVADLCHSSIPEVPRTDAVCSHDMFGRMIGRGSCNSSLPFCVSTSTTTVVYCTYNSSAVY